MRFYIIAILLMILSLACFVLAFIFGRPDRTPPAGRPVTVRPAGVLLLLQFLQFGHAEDEILRVLPPVHQRGLDVRQQLVYVLVRLGGQRRDGPRCGG
jgi:hypothetical protein